MACARTYIDPHLYIYSDEEWANNEFEERFESLLESIVSIKDLESQLPGNPRLFDIRLSNEALGKIYSSNPTLNQPPKAFYFKQFTQAILPEILRRASVCPSEDCSAGATVNPLPAANDAGDERDRVFAAHVAMCRSCVHDAPMYLLKNAEYESLSNALEVFGRVVLAGESAPLLLIDPISIAPFVPVESREEKLNFAIRCFAAIEARVDQQWRGNVNKVIVSDNFWRTLDRADFRHLSTLYKHRILRTLTQIALSIDIDVNAHGMTSQTFNFDNRSINKWNAYVFQSGADAQDRRCSRIYYGFTQGGVILHEYDPDAH